MDLFDIKNPVKSNFRSSFKYDSYFLKVTIECSNEDLYYTYNIDTSFGQIVNQTLIELSILVDNLIYTYNKYKNYESHIHITYNDNIDKVSLEISTCTCTKVCTCTCSSTSTSTSTSNTKKNDIFDIIIDKLNSSGIKFKSKV